MRAGEQEEDEEWSAAEEEEREETERDRAQERAEERQEATEVEPLEEPAEMPPFVSRGSVGHPLTCAAPCKYVRKARGCKDGEECTHCHICVWHNLRPRSPPGSHKESGRRGRRRRYTASSSQ